MRILFAGTPQVAVPSLHALLGSGHDVIGVLTRPDARAGRGRTLVPSPVKQVALEQGLEVFTPDSLRDPEFQKTLSDQQVDMVAVVAYGNIVPKELLDTPTYGWVNLHFSVLPEWRGAAPVQHAIWRGDSVTGASTFLIEEGLDTGPVFGTLTETIRATDTSGELLERLSLAGANLLVATADAIAQQAIQPEQQIGAPSHAPKLEVAQGQIDWTKPAFAIDRQVRAFTPAPGAWTLMPNGQRLAIGPVRVDAAVTDLRPGEVQSTKAGVFVGTSTVAVRLSTVQPPGKKEMEAKGWINGARLEPGTILGVTDV